MKGFMDCYNELESSKFKIGNKRIERIIDLSEIIPKSVSIKNKELIDEWLDTCSPEPLFNFPFLNLKKKPHIELVSSVEDDLGTSKKYLKADLMLTYQKVQIRYSSLIYPGEGFIRHCLEVKVDDSAVIDYSSKCTIDPYEYNGDRNLQRQDYMDCLTLKDLHCRWECTSFLDVTDRKNNLVQSAKGLLYNNEKRVLQGNILYFNKTLKNSGMVFIKEGPTPMAYLTERKGDFEFKGKDLYCIGTGIISEDLKQGHFVKSYTYTIGLCDGTEYGYLSLLNRYYLARHNIKADRDFFVMSNTWGDRSRDSRVSEEFILTELEVAKEIGITCMQIDDGWQQGTTKNSVNAGGRWGDYYSDSDMEFWAVNKERFPNGLEPVVDRARQFDIKLGLWISPDSTKGFYHWQKDAETMVRLHKMYGIDYFKLDGINLSSMQSQENLVYMMQRVLKKTDGKVSFNLDTTAEIRLGYLNNTQYATLFLENRFTDLRRYYPHFTLRNLWQLSKYLPARKFQIELLNTERCQDKYFNDPLSPSNCGIAYAFAVTMFANPLAWMELTGLNEANRKILKKMIKEYNKVQCDILSGHILPIGSEPIGNSWTGFQSILNDQEGYILVYREYNDIPKTRIKLWNIRNAKIELEYIMTTENWNQVKIGQELNPQMLVREINASGKCEFHLNCPWSFALFKYKYK